MASVIAGVQHIDPNAFQKRSYWWSTSHSALYFAKWENKDVVIKVLSPRRSVDDDLDNFKYEIRIMAMFEKCSHTVQLLGTTQIGSNIAFVMEHWSQDLADFLRDKIQVITWPEKRELARQIAQAIAYMHKRNVLHGDIKSENILINDTSQIKLCDFGHSFLKSDPAGRLFKNLSQGIASCSPPWLQPERAKNYFYLYDEACDIFSFGIVMWEIATRCWPHEDATSLDDIKTMLLEEKHEPLPADTDPVYAEWIEKARNFDPLLRPDAEAIVEGLTGSNN